MFRLVDNPNVVTILGLVTGPVGAGLVDVEKGGYLDAGALLGLISCDAERLCLAVVVGAGVGVCLVVAGVDSILTEVGPAESGEDLTVGEMSVSEIAAGEGTSGREGIEDGLVANSSKGVDVGMGAGLAGIVDVGVVGGDCMGFVIGVGEGLVKGIGDDAGVGGDNGPGLVV